MSDKYGAPTLSTYSWLDVSWTLGFSLMTTTSTSSVQISPLTTNLFYIFVLNCLQDVFNLGWSPGQTRLLISRQKAWPIGCTIASVSSENKRKGKIFMAALRVGRCVGSPLAWNWLRAPGRWAYSRTEKAAAAGSVAYITSDIVPIARERIGTGRN